MLIYLVGFLQHENKKRDEITSRKVDENRAEYKQLMIESLLPPAQNVCSAAVHVENVIMWVQKGSTAKEGGVQSNDWIIITPPENMTENDWLHIMPRQEMANNTFCHRMKLT